MMSPLSVSDCHWCTGGSQSVWCRELANREQLSPRGWKRPLLSRWSPWLNSPQFQVLSWIRKIASQDTILCLGLWRVRVLYKYTRNSCVADASAYNRTCPCHFLPFAASLWQRGGFHAGKGSIYRRLRQECNDPTHSRFFLGMSYPGPWFECTTLRSLCPFPAASPSTI